MYELKPCPFCGGSVHTETGYYYFRDYVVYCDTCDSVFTLDDCHATIDDVRKAWNRRAEDVPTL